MIRHSDGLRKRILGYNRNLVINGSFSTDVTSWTATNATPTSVAGGQSGNCLQLQASAESVAKLHQSLIVTVGQVYCLDLYFKRGTSASGSVLIGTDVSPSLYHTSSAYIDVLWTKHSVVFIASSTNLRVTLQSDTATIGTNSLFDEINLYQVSGSFADIFSDCYISLFSSANPSPTQPITPNDAISDIELIKLSLNSTTDGFKFSKTLNGFYVVKDPTQIVSGSLISSGTAKYFRLYRTDENPLISSTEFVRIDGTVGDLLSSEDLLIQSTNITQATALNNIQFTTPME